MATPKSMRDVKELYDKGVNIMRLFRDLESSSSNSLRAILVSYDMQAGSHTEGLQNPKTREMVEDYSSRIAKVIVEYQDIVNDFMCQDIVNTQRNYRSL